MEEDGFDAIFVDEVPDYLKCTGCKYILRNPMLAGQCGHRFCFNCFEKLKRYSVQFKTPLLCPADQKKINESQVCKDTTLETIIGELTVLCTYSNIGCRWKGELSCLESHVETCTENKHENEDGSISDIVRNLCKRADYCEAGLRSKDEEILQLYKTLHQRNEEIRILKNEEIIILKNEHEKFKTQTKKEINFLKSQIMNEIKKFHQTREENKIELQKSNMEINERFKTLNDCSHDIKSEFHKKCCDINVEIEGIKNVYALSKQEISQLQTNFDNEYVDVKNKFSEVNNLSAACKQEVTKLQAKFENEYADVKDEIIKLNDVSASKQEASQLQTKFDNQYTDLNVQFADLKNSLAESNQYIAQLKDNLFADIKKADAQIEDVQSNCGNSKGEVNRMKENFKTLNETITNIIEEGKTIRNLLHTSLDEKDNEINELIARISRNEAVLCNVKEVTPEKTVFEWKLCNYKHHFDLGKIVHSPKFYSEIRGTRCQMKISWTGLMKENLGIRIGICRGRNDGIIEKPFRMQIDFETFDKNGKRFALCILPRTVDATRENCFTILPGEDESKKTYGWTNYLSQRKLDNYIIDDSFTVICTLTPG